MVSNCEGHVEHPAPATPLLGIEGSNVGLLRKGMAGALGRVTQAQAFIVSLTDLEA